MILSRSLIFLTFLITTFLCEAQNSFFELQTLNYKNCSFPYIKCNNSQKLVASKINKLLQIDRLGMLKGFEIKHIFEQKFKFLNPNLEDNYSLEYDIIENNNRVLSISFFESNCGATCYYSKIYYNFDSKDGNVIKLSNIFTANGYESFKKYYSEIVLNTFNKSFKDSLSKDEYEEINETISSVINDTTNFNDFLIQNDSLYIEKWNYLGRGIQFYDNSLNTITNRCFHISEFKHLLNEYGKYLYNISPENNSRINTISNFKLYEGKIGEAPVIMVLNISDPKKISGKYVYNKYGICLELNGNSNNSQIFLHETTTLGDDLGDIKAKLTENHIIGEWYSSKTKKKYSVYLERK